MSLLELHRVRKSYGYDENKIDAVSNVDLFIEEGSFVAIVGTSGSGKSTLLHIMGGLNKQNVAVSFEPGSNPSPF